MKASLQHWAAEERDVYLLGLLRIAIATLLLAHVKRLAVEYMHDGYFGDFFHLPIVPDALVPLRAAYVAWLVLLAGACICALLGIGARWCLLLVSLSCLYILLCDRLQYHNNRYALMVLGFLLAFTPCDRSFVARGGMRPTDAAAPRGPVWAQRMMQVQVALIYLGSSGGKLVDPDWRGGQVMLLRGIHTLEHLTREGYHLPAFVAAAFTSPLLTNLASKAGIATELFIALGLWWPRLRPYALWVGVMFHLGIELSAHVELFSWLMWSSYIVFVTPECRQRVLRYRADSRVGQLLARGVTGLDWLARFRIEQASASAPAFVAVDRDGRAATGLRGLALLARATPLLFPLWLPLHLLAAFTPQSAPHASATPAAS